MTLRRREALALPALLTPPALPALLAGCAAPGGLQIDESLVSRGQDSRVLFLVLHFTVANLSLSRRILTEGEVSAHYLVTDEQPPRIQRLVDESRRAWHAGDSYWRRHAMLNASSIGIEIVYPGPLKLPGGQRTYPPYPPAQIDLVVALCQDIVRRHAIRPERVVGHNEIRPQVKDDPGPMFPWKRLAEAGVGLWPDPVAVDALAARYERELPDAAWFQDRAARHGFRIDPTGRFDEQTRKVLEVFQMRYRPERWDGLADARTAALLHVLTEPK